MDSRIVEKRPVINQTVEKRKLAVYNDPNHVLKPSSSQLMLQVGMTGDLVSSAIDDADSANANLGSKRSSRVEHPPFSIIKKEAEFNSTDSGQKKGSGILGGPASFFGK